MKSARFTVLKLLTKMSNGGFSNIILDKALSESELALQDKRFVTALFYGVIERKITLDYVISNYSSKAITKLDQDILQVLRLGLYQLIYMSDVPDSAAVNESVILMGQAKKSWGGGFVNAILRRFIREGKAIKYPNENIPQMSIRYSCPQWLVEKWINEFGESEAIGLLESTVGEPETSVRVNTLLTNTKELTQILLSEDVSIVNIDMTIDGCVKVKNLSGIEKKDSFKNGLFHVQGVASQICCMAVGAVPGDTVLDLCAAPGGKSFTLAEMMQDIGRIYAFDLHEKRVELIKKGCSRLKINCITARVGDAGIFDENIPFADRILCDVPCAGLGVIRSKPEIKYKAPEELSRLPEIQYNILENASKYLKVGGKLVYSTCSLSKEENDDIIDKFLAQHDDFEGCSFLAELGEPFGKYKATILPRHYNSDGFFIAKIIRRSVRAEPDGSSAKATSECV